ncbi:MAG TPA: GAP family protein [Tepidisphaeraceae bacterium]|jgi:hypothetical protein
MGATMVGLLPLIIAAAVLPTGIVMTLFWLRDRCGLTKAATFAAGRLFAQLIQVVLVGYGLKEVDDAAGARGADHVAPWVLLMVGVLWLAAALVTSLRKPRPAVTVAAPARWVMASSRVSAPAAFGIGALMVGFSMKQWFVTTCAIALIDNARLRQSQAMLAYLYFAVAAQSLILAPVIFTAVAPVRTPRLLTAAQEWMQRNKRGITIGVSLMFGVWFIYQGIT